SSRGVTFRQRHLLGDLLSMLPHARKDAKLDTKRDFSTLVELADIHNCNNILFFEARKRLDLYIWMAKAPNGPTVKLHCQNRMLKLHFSSAYRSDRKSTRLNSSHVKRSYAVFCLQKKHGKATAQRESAPF